MSGGSKVTTTSSEPWIKQQEYLEKGFEGAKDVYMPGGKPTLPGYYSGPTTAGFDPAQQMAQSGALGYAMGTRPEAMQKASENQLLGMYDVSKQIPDYAMGRGDAAQNYAIDALKKVSPTYTSLMGGKVDYTSDDSPYKKMADVYGEQYASQIAAKMPGVRQQMVQYQPGGGSRGDIAQSNIVNAASKNLSQNLAGLYGNAYQQAQAQRMPAAQALAGQYGQAGQTALQAGELGLAGYGGAGQMGTQALSQYPGMMAAPLSMYGAMGDVGAQRRAMSQQAIDSDMARYQYESTKPQQALQNYMASISGDYGGVKTQTTPGQGMMGTLGSLASMAGSLGWAPLASDIRVKENIVPDGTTYKGHNVYHFNYVWDDVRRRGVMAQEVEQTRPDAVVEIDGIKHVYYEAL